MPTTTPPANARLSERAPFFAEVDVLQREADEPRRVWGTDVSEGGMFLQTTHPFRIGEKVSLRFDVPVDRGDGNEDHEVHIRAAEVRWVRPFAPVAVDGQLPGIGLKFLALDPPARAALRRFARPDMREEITLPEREARALASLPPASTSLPPITGSIARMATSTPFEITEEMLAVSLPPFSTPPQKRSTTPVATVQPSVGSLPPDELFNEPFVRASLDKLRSQPPKAKSKTPRMTTQQLAPRDVTMGPRAVSKPATRAETPVVGTPPPSASSTPPEVTAPTMPAPSIVSAPPEPAHPLAGWTFQRVLFDDAGEEEITRRDVPSIPPEARASLAPTSLPPESPISIPPSTSLRPGASLPATAAESLPPHDVQRDARTAPPKPAPPAAPTPSLPPRAGVAQPMRFDDERPSLPSIIVEPTILSIATDPPARQVALEVDIAAVTRGDAAVTDLPRSEPRRRHNAKETQRTKKRVYQPPSTWRALAFACVLIVGGTALGAGLGLAGKKIYRHTKAQPALVPVALTSDAPGDAPSADASSLAPPVVLSSVSSAPSSSTSSSALSASSSPTSPTSPRDVTTAPSPAAVASVADVEKGVPVVAMPAPIADTVATESTAKPALVPLAAKPAARAPDKRASKAFKLDIPVGNAKVARTFTLTAPARVVVDLDGGTTPKAPLDGDGHKTKRVRFGHPSAGTSRIVVELADGVTANDVKANVRDGRLALSFQ
jgi:hypothetical protein